MTRLTRLALSALLLSVALAAVPSASADCVRTTTTPTGGRVCTDERVDPDNVCEAVVGASAEGTPVGVVACTSYAEGAQTCDVVVLVRVAGFLYDNRVCTPWDDGTHHCGLHVRVANGETNLLC